MLKKYWPKWRDVTGSPHDDPDYRDCTMVFLLSNTAFEMWALFDETHNFRAIARRNKHGEWFVFEGSSGMEANAERGN